MRARVKQSHKWRIAQSGGMQYVKDEWRPVPPGHEAEVLRCDFLEFQDPQPDPEPEPETVELPAPEPKPEPKGVMAKVKARAKGKKK